MGSNAEVARRGFEAVVRGDLDAVRELLDPNVKWHGGTPGPGSCHNRDEALAFIRQARATGGMAQLEAVVDAGERVVVVLRQPSGVRRANVTTFRDGKVVEMQAYERVDAALEAVGVTPSG